MSQADDLLATLSVDYTDEDYIYVNDDRTITVPDELQHIAVEHDHNIETVVIDCPRYWDGHDFSKMTPYINYMRPDGYKDSYRAKNLRVSDEDDTRILFDWTISANVTQIKGNLSFLVYVEDPDANPCWHSRLNQQMVIDEGLSCKVQIEMAPDSIEEVLARTTASYIEKAKAEIEGKTAQALASIPEDYTTVNNMAEEALREKATVIKMEAEGDTIIVNDSADNALIGLKIYGKTTQITTTGKQLASVDINVADYVLKGVFCSATDDGNILVSGTSTEGLWNRLAWADLVAGETYTLSSNGALVLTVWDATAEIDIAFKERNVASITFTASNTGKHAFVLSNTAHSVFSSVRADIMLNTGSTALPWEAYSAGVASPNPDCPWGLVNIESANCTVYGANLFPLREVTAVGVTGTPQEDGSILYTGTADSNAWQAYQQCPIFADGTYTLSVETSNKTNKGSLIQILDERGLIGRSWQDVDEYFTCTFDAVAGGGVRWSIGVVPDEVVNTTVKLMLNPGSSALSWEPYVNTQPMTTSAILRGIPVTSGGNYTDSDGQQWICDEVDFERGVYVQRVLEYAPTSIVAVASGSKNNRASVTLPHPGLSFSYTDANGYCSHFKYNASVYSDTGNELGFIVSSQTLFFRFTSSSGITTTELGQQWIDEQADSGTPFTVTYILATPIETPLSSAELASFKMVRSNYPTTTVLNDSGAHMVIKYAADTKTYVEKFNRNAGARRYPDWSHLKWYVLGDSLTDPAGGIHTDKFYYEYVAEKTGIQVIVDGLGGTGYYAGVSEGKRFADRVKNIPTDVDIVTIFGSGNDVAHASADEYKSAMSATMGYFFLNRPGLPVIIVPPSPWKTYNKRSDEWKGYCDMLELMALNFSLHYMGEMWTAPPFDPNSEAAFAAFFSKCRDGIHPDENGHRALASYFYNAMNKILAFRNLDLDDEV